MASLVGFAVATKKCDKLMYELMQRRPLAPGDRRTCARCQRACRGAAIRSIDMAGGRILSSKARYQCSNQQRRLAPLSQLEVPGQAAAVLGRIESRSS